MSTIQQEALSPNTQLGEGTIKLGDIYSPMASLDSLLTPPSLEAPRIKCDDLKVEEPLTLDHPPFAPKSVRFSNIIEEMDLASLVTADAPALESSFFDDAFGPAAERAIRLSEQEKLIEADATARVDVPKLDFALRSPPWKAFDLRDPGSVKASQRNFIKELVGQRLQKWTGSNPGLKLKYNPFPHNLAKVALEEDFGACDANWESFVGSKKEKVVDSSSLTWRPPEPRILREEEDEDEIEPGKFPKQKVQDLSFLVKKRKMELEESCSFEDRQSQDAVPNITMLPGNQIVEGGNPNPTANISINEKSLEGAFLSGALSAGASLDNYLELRGSKKAKLSGSFHSGPTTLETHALPVLPSIEQNQLKELQLPIGKSTVADFDTLPAPPIHSLNMKINVIVSTIMLKDRALTRKVEKLLPELTLIERDFSARNTTTWMPGSVSRSPIASPLDSEADLIVSPSTGIVITSLQKIKQKPLPGQKARSAIRERVEKVSMRYENLFVLVSEGRADENTNGFDESDSLAFSEFVGFSLGLDSSITVQFVGGSVETLAKWLASVIIRHRVGGDSDLLQEETHWELFLRRAGLNAFAAQAVISNVKAPEGVDTGSPTKAGHFGLTAFVEMGKDQRLARFEHICGRRVLERASAVVDARWRLD